MVQDRRFFGHPRGLAVLFFTEMWERFGYYGMRALLILYLTAEVARGGLGFDAASAGSTHRQNRLPLPRERTRRATSRLSIWRQAAPSDLAMLCPGAERQGSRS